MGDSPPLAQCHALPVREISPGREGVSGAVLDPMHTLHVKRVCIKIWNT